MDIAPGHRRLELQKGGIVNEQQSAEQEAQALAAMLNGVLGDGWGVKVWDNGSACAIHSSGVKVYDLQRAGTLRYAAYYDPKSREVGTGATPLQALAALRSHWETQIDQLQRELAHIQRVFGETR
jgi:hypothetical protein